MPPRRSRSTDGSPRATSCSGSTRPPKRATRPAGTRSRSATSSCSTDPLTGGRPSTGGANSLPSALDGFEGRVHGVPDGAGACPGGAALRLSDQLPQPLRELQDRQMRGAFASVLCLAVLAIAPATQAAQRFAAPEGGGPEPCTQAAPCPLKLAVTKAKANDEVIVTGGTYTVKEPMYPEGAPANVDIHGDFGGPMPRIVGSGTALTIYVVGAGSRLSYVE